MEGEVFGLRGDHICLVRLDGMEGEEGGKERLRRREFAAGANVGMSVSRARSFDENSRFCYFYRAGRSSTSAGLESC